MIDLRLLTSLNAIDNETLDLLAGMIEDGTLAATTDGDAIVALRLTEAGKAMLPPFCRRPAHKDFFM
jgi:hypothetical protein